MGLAAPVVFPIMERMIELHVMGIALDTRTGTPIVVLNDAENRRALPIWIGTAEASAIIRQLEGIETPRPMTHDLLYSAITKMGYTAHRIEINEVQEETYFATILLKDKDGNELALDARPSDAIALSLRADIGIFATPSVVAEGMISTDQERDEEEAEQFKSFVANLKASDFKFDPGTESRQ